MEKIGIVYGEVIGKQFSFASNKYFEGDFVSILEEPEKTDSSTLICQIVNRGIRNQFVIQPEVIHYISDQMDVQKDTIYTYTAKSIGTIKNGNISSTIHAIPGKEVYSANADDVKTVYGIKNSGYQIGFLKKMPECTVALEANSIFNPHLFIVGKTGSGKSFFTTHLLSRLNETFWVFSPTDEYSGLVSKDNCDYLSDFVLELNPDSISYYADLSSSEEMILKSISFDDKKVYSYEDIVEEIYHYYAIKDREHTIQMTMDLFYNNPADIVIPNYANSLIKKLKTIRNLRFTKNREMLRLSKQSHVFYLGNYTQQEQECIVNHFLFGLLQQVKRLKTENREKHIVVVEEAHNYMPSVRSTLSKAILVRLSREGRKYGISLCFITQRPRFFDQTALSQSGSRIIFALPNPDDVKHIMDDIPFYNSELSIDIQTQKTGECVIASDSFNDVLETVIQFD